METMAQLTQIPPHSVEAEQSVLGAMLLDREAVYAALEVLRPEDFYKEAHREIFHGAVGLFQRQEPLDLLTLTEELRRRETLEAVGGIAYLTSLTSNVPMTVHVEHYARMVEEKAVLRRLIHSSRDIMEQGFRPDMDARTLIEQAQKNIYDITQSRYQQGFTHIKELLGETFDEIERRYENKETITGLTTGFNDLDHKLNGLHKSDLILVAARPAMGKSAFALNLAHNAALKSGASVAVFSLEMSKEQLILRMLAAESMVDLGHIQSGRLNEEEWTRIAKAMVPLSRAHIHFDDSAGTTVTEMRSKARRLKMEKGLDLVLIDYLQLMQGETRTENRQQEISKISRNLKIMAKELDCPVIALSQLSRAPEQRADHKPILSDLRESGAIEQDADVVIFLYREAYYDEESENQKLAEIIVSKHRHGETGTIEMVWLGEFQKFADASRFRS